MQFCNQFVKSTFIVVSSIFAEQRLQAQNSNKFFEQSFELSSIQLNRATQLYNVEICKNYLRFLEVPFPTNKKVSITVEEFHSLKNDVADKLLAQSNLPNDFDQRFLAMLDNKSLSNVWHNYILQKLDVLFERSNNAQLKARILSRLFRETRNPKTTISGTSLMTLLRLEKKFPEVVDETKLSKCAEWLTEQERYPFQDRLSALHVLAELSPEKAFVPARKWLLEKDSHTMLKTAALAVLGKSASTDDLVLIESYQNHPDLRLRTASENALRVSAISVE